MGSSSLRPFSLSLISSAVFMENRAGKSFIFFIIIINCACSYNLHSTNLRTHEAHLKLQCCVFIRHVSIVLLINFTSSKSSKGPSKTDQLMIVVHPPSPQSDIMYTRIFGGSSYFGHFVPQPLRHVQTIIKNIFF